MASLPESPVDEEIGYDLIDNEPISIFRPVGGLDDLCKQTKFTRQEIRVMYRGFKQVSDFHHTWIREQGSVMIA